MDESHSSNNATSQLHCTQKVDERSYMLFLVKFCFCTLFYGHFLSLRGRSFSIHLYITCSKPLRQQPSTMLGGGDWGDGTVCSS